MVPYIPRIVSFNSATQLVTCYITSIIPVSIRSGINNLYYAAGKLPIMIGMQYL